MTRPHSEARRSLDRAVTDVSEAAARGPLLRSGVDVVGIERIARLLAEFGQSFRDRIFTPAEQTYCDGRPDPAQHYAARWAAKEAFRKAVAAAGPNVPFDAVGVARTPDGPTLELTAPAAEALDDTLRRESASPERAATSVSLAHDQPAGIAVAHVVIAGEREGETDGPEPPTDGDER